MARLQRTGKHRLLPGLLMVFTVACVEKMPLPMEINEPTEFTAGDTTYLRMNPIWDHDHGFVAPIELSIAPDGHIFVADSAARRIFVLKQDGTPLEGFDALTDLTNDANEPLSPIDVDVDQKMNVFIIDGSRKVYRWNQIWNDIGIASISTSGTFVNVSSGATVSATAGSPSWFQMIDNDEWRLDRVEWSADVALIDSLLRPHLFFDAGAPRNAASDIYYPSGKSLFTGLSAADGNYIYVTDGYNDRIIRINFQRSHLIRLESGDEVWAHRGMFGHTATGFGTGAGTVNKPAAIDVDFQGNIYYAQSGEYFSIHKIKPVSTGGYMTYPSVFQQGVNDIMDLWRFSNPSDVAVDNKQRVYVANTEAQEIQVFNSDGSFFKKAGVTEVTVDTSLWVFTGTDSALVDTFLTVEQKGILDMPRAVAVDTRGMLYVCDPSRARIVRYRLSNSLDENVVPEN